MVRKAMNTGTDPGENQIRASRIRAKTGTEGMVIRMGCRNA